MRKDYCVDGNKFECPSGSDMCIPIQTIGPKMSKLNSQRYFKKIA